MMDRTSIVKSVRILNVLVECSLEFLASVMERQITSQTVLETLREFIVRRGTPKYVHNEYGGS